MIVRIHVSWLPEKSEYIGTRRILISSYIHIFVPSDKLLTTVDRYISIITELKWSEVHYCYMRFIMFALQ